MPVGRTVTQDMVQKWAERINKVSLYLSKVHCPIRSHVCFPSVNVSSIVCEYHVLFVVCHCVCSVVHFSQMFIVCTSQS